MQDQFAYQNIYSAQKAKDYTFQKLDLSTNQTQHSSPLKNVSSFIKDNDYENPVQKDQQKTVQKILLQNGVTEYKNSSQKDNGGHSANKIDSYTQDLSTIYSPVRSNMKMSVKPQPLNSSPYDKNFDSSYDYQNQKSKRVSDRQKIDQFEIKKYSRSQSPQRSGKFRKIKGRLSNSPFYKDAIIQTYKKNHKNKKKLNHSQLVDKIHKIDFDDLEEFLKEIKRTNQNVKSFPNLIENIFKKIQGWKNSFGDLFQQEKEISIKLSNSGNSYVTHIHNVKSIMIKMNELQNEIQLTKEEINFIVYTSLDLDWFNNMLILQTEFSKWFNIQFQGMNRDEIDFKDSKLQIWIATVKYANILQEQFLNQPPVRKVSVFKQSWWMKVRFQRFGLQLNQKFEENPLLKTILRNIFSDHKDKLSYFYLFEFINDQLQIQIEDWERDALESRLDRLGLAFIEFNEFNQFCMEYGIDWDEEIIHNDLEDILQYNLDVSFTQYKITSKDFFNGCPTILNSEKAALALASHIYIYHKFKQSIGQNTLRYTDPDFGPLRKSDEKGNRYSLYKNGEIPRKGYPDPLQVEWVQADSLCQDKPIKFIDNGLSSDDCIQGNLGNCWFISALSVLATQDQLIVGGFSGMEYDQNMIVDNELASALSKGVYPPIFHRFREIGLYIFRFFKNFTWVYVMIDLRIPVDKVTKKPIFGSCRNQNELWVALIEKAYAKLHGCYENLISGYVDEGIQELTGYQSEKIPLKDEKSNVFPHKMIEKHYGGSEGFWKFLNERKQDNCLMGCSINGQGKQGQLIINGNPCGLILNHAYGICDIIQLQDQSKNLQIKLLRLRNPWGKSEWNGTWSSKSQELKTYKRQLDQYIRTLPPDERFDVEADDGTFFIDYDDWKNLFSKLFLNIDFPQKWTGVRFNSAWTLQNSGGVPNMNEKSLLQRYGINPQFYIQPNFDTEVMFSLQQLRGRLPENGEYSQYPFSERLQYACVAVFQLKENEVRLNSFEKEKLIFLSPLKKERENQGRVFLKAGQAYVIVASAENANFQGKFNLSIYFNQKLRDVNVKRVFNQNEILNTGEEILPFLIPEEAEKLISQVPVWKLQLVKDSLKYIMKNQDFVASNSEWKKEISQNVLDNQININLQNFNLLREQTKLFYKNQKNLAQIPDSPQRLRNSQTERVNHEYHFQEEKKIDFVIKKNNSQHNVFSSAKKDDKKDIFFESEDDVNEEISNSNEDSLNEAIQAENMNKNQIKGIKQARGGLFLKKYIK